MLNYLEFSKLREIPDPLEEDSVNDNVPGSVIADEQTDQPVQYDIVESSTQRGRKKLADSSGYSYTVRDRVKEMPSGCGASETRQLLVWQLSGSMEWSSHALSSAYCWYQYNCQNHQRC